jgi:cobalamin biosynthesis protein CobD/CbiB
MTTLWLLRIIGGLPALTAPILWFGGLFAFLAEGISDAQRMYVLAGMAYPLVYVGCFVASVGFVRSGDIPAAQFAMAGALAYGVVVLALWPVLGLE